ncbi:inositol-3-phosphate synthase [Candidatus Hecatella orcuttiae]|uniref:inositol-3-phosphate synthase n=1 Tax=Candidatus Hecatella orcuttiae TaxID=1935119 RepID=UPI002867BE3A|nr:inositol-3-phosphate synthase [Candidatus Hecatella orcuttiae]
MAEIRVAIAGVGNCASSLVQGVYYYRNVSDDEKVLGLMHTVFGGYRIGDIRFVAAFDVDPRKIGKDLSQAIFSAPNCTLKFSDVPYLGVPVQPAPMLDGVAPHMMESFGLKDDDPVEPVEIVDVLRASEADMLINYLPVGSRQATQYYAEAALKAGCGFVNAIPEFIASSPEWVKRYEEVGLPLAGDDIKSQVGATIIHRTLVELLESRGVKVDETYQLNIGGNTDFLNMTVEDRLARKRISKTEAVTSLLPYEIPVRIGPSDYVPFLNDQKICYLHIKGKKFGGASITVDLKLAVEDSPNSAGVMVDVIRAMKLGLDRELGGVLTSISAYAFKHPPQQVPDHQARVWVEEFIQGKRQR